VQEHFGWEEACMHQHRCPVAEVNKRAHSRFIETFQAIRARFDQEGPSVDLLLQIKQELGDWLVNHIRRIDTGLRPCVAKSSPPSGLRSN
jgi:hemerythrin